MLYIYGAILAFGVVYILANIFLGGLGGDSDFGVDVDADFDVDIDTGVDVEGDSEAVGISLNVIAAFAVGVGAVGVGSTLAGWPPIATILASILFGLILGRIFQNMMRFVLRQEGGDVITAHSLIGQTARVTVNTPAGRLGEALIEEPERIKYAIRNIEADQPLEKGDIVQIISVESGRLHVKKAN